MFPTTKHEKVMFVEIFIFTNEHGDESLLRMMRNELQ